MLNRKRLIVVMLLVLPLLSQLHASSTTTKTVAFLEAYGLDPVVILLIISALPIIELRGAIPVGIFLFGMPWPKVAIISIIGNMLPIPFLLLLLDKAFAILERFKWGKRFTTWLYARTRRKGKVIERFQAIGLTVFVGIPLPGTGGWTGSLAAKIFGIRFWNSMLYIFLGVVIAAIIVTALCLAGLMAVG